MHMYQESNPYSYYESDPYYEMASIEEFQCPYTQFPPDSDPSLLTILEIFHSEVVSLSTRLSSLEENLKMKNDPVAQPEMNVPSLPQILLCQIKASGYYTVIFPKSEENLMDDIDDVRLCRSKFFPSGF